MRIIQKNAREEIRIERTDFKGHDLINVRVFYDDGSGDKRPSKQGIALRTELLPEIVDALCDHLDGRAAA